MIGWKQIKDLEENTETQVMKWDLKSRWTNQSDIR